MEKKKRIFTKSPDRKRIFINVETVSRFGRDIYDGIKQFAVENRWEIHFEPRALSDQLPLWFRYGTWDGIISRSGNKRIVNELLKKEAPRVELIGTGPQDEPEVMVSREGVARLIFDHFYERGFRHFAIFSYEDTWWSYLEKKSYREILKRRRFDCHVFKVRSNRRVLVPKWTESNRDRLRSWLLELPKPVGLFVMSDAQAIPVYQTCQELNLRIPVDVAIVSVENDELLCNVLTPTLSSVDQNGKKIGYLAAELLRDRMEGKRLERQKITVPPLMIKARQSSDCVTIDDANLVDVFQYIRDMACYGLTVNDVVEFSNFSHATLGRLFKKWLGRTIEEDIRYVRVEQAKHLLQETQIGIASVAKMTGFSSPEYFCHVFRQFTKMSPTEFRDYR